jgi:Na+/proline symporter
VHFPDYIVVGSILLLLLVISLRCSRRAGRSTEEFILAGRRMPWWLAGISIAVTQLNANNVLQDTRKAREDGISGMWFSWNQIIGQAIGTAWFLRLWRRAGFNTQMEFYLARYTGWQAHFTRLFDSFMFGGVASLLWGAMGLIGMKKVLHVLFVIPPSIQIIGLSLPTDWFIITGLVTLSLTFTILAGVHGVVWTDLAEFLIAIFATYFLLFLVLHQVGWGEGLRARLATLGPATRHSLDFLPPWGLILVYYLFVSPFLNQGGWSPAIQRCLCVKDECEVVYTSISNSILTFAVRGVPFIIIGLCAWILVPDAELLSRFPPLHLPDGSLMPDRERIYPLLAMRLLPTGMLGMAVGAFLCAFIVALSTNIHNSTAVFVNDCYRAYISPNREDHHYVTAARVYIVFATLITILFGISVDNILAANMLIITLVVGAGFVKLLRFVWWRVNGSAEVAAQISSVTGLAFFLTPPGKRLQVFLAHSVGLSGNDGFYISAQFTLVAFSTLAALAVMALTRPEPKAHLSAFYDLVRPFGFWGPVRSSDASEPDPFGLQLGLTIAIIAINIGVLGAMLLFFLGFDLYAAAAAIAALASWLWIRHLVRRLYPRENTTPLHVPFSDGTAVPEL